MLVLKLPVTQRLESWVGRFHLAPNLQMHIMNLGAPILKHLAQFHHSGSNVPLS